MARGPVVPVIKVAAQFAAVLGDSCLVVTNVAPAPVTVVGEHGSRAQCDQKQEPCNRAFHMLLLLITVDSRSGVSSLGTPPTACKPVSLSRVAQRMSRYSSSYRSEERRVGEECRA